MAKDHIIVMVESLPARPQFEAAKNAPKGRVFGSYTHTLREDGEHDEIDNPEVCTMPELCARLLNEGGKGIIFVPYTHHTEGDVHFCIVVAGITREQEAQARIEEEIHRLTRKSMLIGGLFGALFGSDRAEDGDGTLSGRAAIKKHTEALTPGSKIVVMPANYRGNDPEQRVEVPYATYNRLMELEMIDPCPVCTLREDRLVCHTEDDYTMEDVLRIVREPIPNASPKL
jgi:hypothetical protein